ncbi:MAG: hypothetical protein ACRD8W_22075, partial [Nitrososphaeraceae archaeon]
HQKPIPADNRICLGRVIAFLGSDVACFSGLVQLKPVGKGMITKVTPHFFPASSSSEMVLLVE